MVFVFPDPAPAKISSGPSTWRAALLCSGFSSSSSFIVIPKKSLNGIFSLAHGTGHAFLKNFCKKFSINEARAGYFFLVMLINDFKGENR